MKNPWANTLGQWAATAATFYCGGCGGAVWSAYYTYQATGSATKGVAVGVLTYVSNNVEEYYSSRADTLIVVKSTAAAASAKITGGDAGRAFAMAALMEGGRIGRTSISEPALKPKVILQE